MLFVLRGYTYHYASFTCQVLCLRKGKSYFLSFLVYSYCVLLPKNVINFILELSTWWWREWENTTRLWNQTPSMSSICIQCMVRSHDRKNDHFLALLTLNIQVLKGKKSEAYLLSLNGQMPKSNSNKNKFTFSLRRYHWIIILQVIRKALLVLQEYTYIQCICTYIYSHHFPR